VLARLAAFPSRAPRSTLALALALGLLGAVAGRGLPNRLSTSPYDFISHGSESYTTAQLLTNAADRGALPGLIALVPSRGPIQQVQAELQRSPLVAVVAPKVFYARDRRTAAIAAYLSPEFPAGASAGALAQQLRRFPGVLLGGSDLADHELSTQVTKDALEGELIAFPLLLLLTLWVFRGVVAALLPVLIGALALVITLLCLRIVDALYPLSIFSLSLITGAALGLALDYSLLLVSRYREELTRLGDVSSAVAATMATAGRTVAFSATTIALAFASLLIYPLNLLRSMAIGGLLIAPIAGMLSIVVLTAVFALLGSRVNGLAPQRWQRAGKRASRPDEDGAWYRLARFIMRRPIATAFTAAAILIACGIPTIGARLTGVDARVLPPDTGSRLVQERLYREFPPSVVGETVVVVHGGGALAKRVVAEIRRFPNLAAAGSPERLDSALWQVNVDPAQPPFSPATKRLVQRLRSLSKAVTVTGETAAYLDTSQTLRRSLPFSLAFLALTTLLVLFIATRSVILPLKALLMNVLSLSAALGAVVFIFQDGRLEGSLGYRGEGALELVIPILVGTTAFGLVTDYGVFLLTRIKESWDSGLSNRDAIALGLERTGRIITAAALLLCVAVGVLATSRIALVKEVGVGVTMAVIVDASLVRAFLVPSLMALLGRWNWWRPGVERRGAQIPP
jgi:uncharacterized membrane protein YdfJ with MMPL/SSD domain